MSHHSPYSLGGNGGFGQFQLVDRHNGMLNRWKLYRKKKERGVLVEIRNDAQIIYGPWDGEFGCWRAVDSNSGLRPYFPPWKFIGPEGGVMAPVLVKTAASFDITQYRTVNFNRKFFSGLVEYGEKIPMEVRMIAGHFRVCQWLALDAMRYTPGFMDFLRQEINGFGLNYVLACWTLAKADSLSIDQRIELNKEIIFEKRKHLLAKLAGSPVGNIFIKSLAKLDQKHLNISAIRGFLLITQCPEKAKTLSMMDSLSSMEIKLLNNLPKWLAHPKLVYVLKEAAKENLELEDIIPPGLLNAPYHLRNRIKRSLLTADNLDELEYRVAKWSQKIFDDVTFPAPPIPGDNCLVPIGNGLELRNEGKEMASCVAGYALDVAAGISYFYRWLGHQRATVQLKKDLKGNWYLHEHLGRGNERLDDGEITAIAITVTWQLAATANVALTAHVAGTPHCQEEDILDTLYIGQELFLRREPDNPHDYFAIEVFTKDGVKLGYVPRRRNRGIAHYMDHGIAFSTRIIKLTDNLWEGIIIEIRMDDRFLEMLAPSPAGG